MNRLRSHMRALAVAAFVAAGLSFVPTATPVSAVDCPQTGGPVGCPGVNSPVAGYILIQQQSATGSSPTYQLGGALAVPTEWTCSGSTLAGGAYNVSCTATPSNFMTWRCDLLHADVTTTSASGPARVTLDCDGAAPAEAQTSAVSGIGRHDTKWALAGNVVTFSCTVDDGAGSSPAPDFIGGCGDPGLVEVTTG